MKFQKNNAFTLIEMLIVIVIIGILAAALVPRLQAVQGRARDTKRKADITQLYNALQMYKLDFGVNVLPSGTCTYAADCALAAVSTSGSVWIPSITGYMTALPVDPINNATLAYLGGYNYMYGYVYRNGKVSQLYANLENKQDPDRCEIQKYSYYDGSSLIANCSVPAQCPYSGCYSLYMRNDMGQ